MRDAFINVPRNCCSSDLERYSALLTDRVRNQTLSAAVKTLEGGLNGQLSEHRIFFNEVADAIAHDLEREASRGIALGGATNLLKHPEYSDFGKASGLLSVLETKEKLYQILTKATPMEFTISIGSENELEEMRNSSIVTATYRIAGNPVGSFGIIGPTRMNYSRIIALLNCMGQSLSEVFTNMLTDENNNKT